MNPELVLFILRIVMAVILYVFLATILVYLWRDLKSNKISKSIAPKAHLEKLENGELDPAYPLAELNLIGRAEDNTLVIKQGTVSGYHARLSYQQDQWWLEDLGSRNGTFVNDLPVTEPLVITYGDELGFGTVRLRLVSGAIPQKTDIMEHDTEED